MEHPSQIAGVEASNAGMIRGDKTYSSKSDFPWLLDKYQYLLKFIYTLDEDKEYALVAAEF